MDSPCGGVEFASGHGIATPEIQSPCLVADQVAELSQDIVALETWPSRQQFQKGEPRRLVAFRSSTER